MALLGSNAKAEEEMSKAVKNATRIFPPAKQRAQIAEFGRRIGAIKVPKASYFDCITEKIKN